MSVEIQDPVVEPKPKVEISPLAEETTPKPDEPQAEGNLPTKEEKKHPLEPGGDRFNQVWARSKKAEDEARQLREELQREREERIRLEERSRVKEEQSQAKEMSWDELETGIEQGKWTRAQAQEYKDKMAEQRLERRARQEREQQTRDQRYLSELDQYKSLVPDVMTYGSENRVKYERELTYMVRQLGMPDTYATQVAAARAAFGDVETVRSRQEAKRTLTNKEPFEETHTPSKPASNEKDFSSTLTPEQKTHYEKMIRVGVYKDWKEVEDEMKYVPKSINRR